MNVDGNNKNKETKVSRIDKDDYFMESNFEKEDNEVVGTNQDNPITSLFKTSGLTVMKILDKKNKINIIYLNPAFISIWDTIHCPIFS